MRRKSLNKADISEVLEEMDILFRVHIPDDGRRKVCLLVIDDTWESVCLFYYLLKLSWVVILMNAKEYDMLADRCISRYQPYWVLSSVRDDTVLRDRMYSPINVYHQYHIWSQKNEGVLELYQLIPDIAVLLPTSGSTGSVKFVALSRENLQINAELMGRSLGVQKGDRAVLMLPFSYAYGVSVITSYMEAGGTMLFPSGKITQNEYWDELEAAGVQAIFGVGYTYEIIQKMQVLDRPFKHLKLLAQAGELLPEQTVRSLLKQAKEHNAHFAVLYGQTEATGCMSCFFADEHEDKINSVGRALEDSKFYIQREEEYPSKEPNQIGEVIYCGENISQGYVISWRQITTSGFDMAEKPTDSFGGLHTGDVGYLDEDGYLYLIGRKKRIIKYRGWRIDLDELQSMMTERVNHQTVCIPGDESIDKPIRIIVEGSRIPDPEVEFELERMLLELPVGRITASIESIERFPRDSDGVIVYDAMIESYL